MESLKASGLDGMATSFYKRYWDCVRSDVIATYLGFLNEEADLLSINKTLIVLIPKIQNPKTPKDFRPISFCNVIYKLVLKVLKNQMKLVLP